MQGRIKFFNGNCLPVRRLIPFLFCFSLIGYTKAQPLKLEGTASAIDGDTIIINSYKIRLEGVSAPELSEEGGNEAKLAMQTILKNKNIKCSLSGQKSYERHVGTCWLGAVDIGALLIMQGMARDCVRYSRGRYRALETLSAQHLPLPKYCLKRSKKAKTN